MTSIHPDVSRPVRDTLAGRGVTVDTDIGIESVERNDELIVQCTGGFSGPR